MPDGARLRAAVLLALVAVTVAASSTQAQVRRDSSGYITGTVVSAVDGDPLPRAQITIAGTNRRTIGDDVGRFTVTGLPEGMVTLQTRALGYRMVPREVFVPGGGRAEVIIAMTPLPQTLVPVRTTGTTEERDRFERGASAGVISIGGGIVSKVPSIGEADVLRTVQLLPGVTARSDFTAGYNVRGGESDQNLVLLDGIPVYNPFHFGGLFGTFLEPTVGEVTLHVGGFSAEHGGRLSSVLDVRSAEEERAGVHGTVGLSVLATSVALSGALPDRGTTWSIAGRRTYADAFARLFTDEVLPYHFEDAQLHLTQRLPRDATLSITAYAGLDDLGGNFAALGDSTRASGGDFSFNWGNTIAGATLTMPLGRGQGDGASPERATLVQRLSVSRFRTRLDLGDGSLSFDNRVLETRASGSVTVPIGKHAPIFGYEASLHDLGYQILSEEANVELFGLKQRPSALSLFAEDRWSPTSDLRIRIGARTEGISGRGWEGISPRVSATYFVTPELSVSLAGGRYTQWLHGLRNEDIPVRIFDFWIASDRYIDVSSARHAILGVERWFSSTRLVRIEGFYKRYDHLLEPNSADDPAVRGDEFVPSSGTSYGFDVLLRQLERGPLSGWIAYTYGVSSRRRGTLEYFPAQDRRHNVNAVASYALGARTTLGARFGFGTGLPFTDIVGQIVRRTYDPGNNAWTLYNGARPFEPVGGDRNASRYPTFQRLDLMLTRRFTRGRTTILPYLQVVNAYNRKNVFIYTFDYTNNPPERQATSQFPFLPSLGMTVAF